MCSSARSPSGSRTRWAAGSRGGVHRVPEGCSRRAACGVLQGAGGVPGLVLQVEGRGAPAAAARRERLKAEIARLFGQREGKDGAPRITAALREQGWRVSENTVAGLMRQQ